MVLLDERQAISKLGRAIPPEVRILCETLNRAGHEAWTVGGGVRDVLMGRVPGDWDVATDAMPRQVKSLFRKVIPTGIAHGTVTVVIRGKGAPFTIEVTTFRGESGYSDARRPDSVELGVSLQKDLSRRDFVINAIAFDPVGQTLFDPFGGREDVAKQRIQAVGKAEERFREDGLRVMRAIRFVSVLNFELEAETKAALSGALSSLSKVARERILIELHKLLEGQYVEGALRIAFESGVLQSLFPPLVHDDCQALCERVAAVGAELDLRLMALLWQCSIEDVQRIVETLTTTVKTRKRVVSALQFGREAPDVGASEAELRRWLAAMPKQTRADTLHLWTHLPNPLQVDLGWTDDVQTILERCDPLAVADLALKGADLIRELPMKPGPEVGRLLAALLAAVHSDPSMNEREVLLSAAKRLVSETPASETHL